MASLILRLPILLVFTIAVFNSIAGAQVATCSVSRERIQLHCPDGWTVLDESDRETNIGNYLRAPDEPKNVLGGPGRAWITFMTLPSLYRNLDEWIFAGTKNAPEAIRTSRTVKNTAVGEVKVTCLESPERSVRMYFSCYFQLDKTPALLELNYRTNDPKKAEYRAATLRMIETGTVAGRATPRNRARLKDLPPLRRSSFTSW